MHRGSHLVSRIDSRLDSCLGWHPKTIAIGTGTGKEIQVKYLYLAAKFSQVKRFLKLNKILVLIAFFLLLSCSDDGDDSNQFLPNVPVNQTIFLNNPEFIDLQVVGGWAYSQGGISGIIIYHSGINNYLAFERSAPHLRPQSCSRMNVENSLFMVCPCDDAEFNLLNGAPLTEGINFPARQYRVLITGPNTLQITNF